MMNEEEKNVLMDHEYDGIQEFDFQLPNWWLATFWGGIIFAVFYISYFIFMNGPSLKHEYYMEAKELRSIQKKYMAKLKDFKSNEFEKFRNDENMLLYGQAVYENNCQACHNQNAAGDIGPNLTDNHWMYFDGTSEELFKFIITGNPDAGMPAWGRNLSREELYAVSAFVESLKGFEHNDPPAKEPQGDEY
ncbi:c-type cytochrome [Bacteriovoracaceae bacterium]|nr:c-type cytochrome [Bacteriovoracaceae bacterium]